MWSAVVGAVLAVTLPADARTWTNAYGRTFEADFVRREGVNVIFAFADGRTVSTPLAELSAGDQAALQGGGQNVQPAVESTFDRPWPREIRIEGPVACKVISEDPKTRVFVYESPGYRFTCDARVTDDALRNFSVMFEATRKYALELPLAMGNGRDRKGKYDIRLFGAMSAYVQAGGTPGSAGCFRPDGVLVPMASLGLREGGTGFSLDTARHNHVLVHELAHQLTPIAYLQPGALGWFSEGLAEYMSITPYNWGYFRPDIHGNVVKAYVTATGETGTGGRALGTRLTVPKLKGFFLMPYGQFSGLNANLNYGTGLLLTHYFFHMEGGGKARRITQFLKGMQAGQRGEASLKPLLDGDGFEKLESEISAAWARMGVEILFR